MRTAFFIFMFLIGLTRVQASLPLEFFDCREGSLSASQTIENFSETLQFSERAFNKVYMFKDVPVEGLKDAWGRTWPGPEGWFVVAFLSFPAALHTSPVALGMQQNLLCLNALERCLKKTLKIRFPHRVVDESDQILGHVMISHLSFGENAHMISYLAFNQKMLEKEEVTKALDQHLNALPFKNGRQEFRIEDFSSKLADMNELVLVKSGKTSVLGHFLGVTEFGVLKIMSGTGQVMEFSTGEIHRIKRNLKECSYTDGRPLSPAQAADLDEQ